MSRKRGWTKEDLISGIQYLLIGAGFIFCSIVVGCFYDSLVEFGIWRYW